MSNTPSKQDARVTVSGKVDLKALAVCALWLRDKNQRANNWSKLLASCVEGMAEVLIHNGARDITTYAEASSELEKLGLHRNQKMKKEIFHLLHLEAQEDKEQEALLHRALALTEEADEETEE